jgi:phage shock protein A
MNSLKRLYISIKGQVDQVADEFENHEALAGVAIQDLQAIASQTRLHLHRISKMTEQYQKQLNEQKEQEALWASRAIKAKKQDEQKALQCVKRLVQTKKQISLLERQQQESAEQENKIRDDLNALQEQLQILKNKKEILAARQNRSHLQEALQDGQSNPLNDVQHVFDRWEGRVVSAEYDTPAKTSDTLLNSFEQEEETEALQKMLDELTESDNN